MARTHLLLGSGRAWCGVRAPSVGVRHIDHVTCRACLPRVADHLLRGAHDKRHAAGALVDKARRWEDGAAQALLDHLNGR